jgi:hypothetical protein
VKGLIYVSGKMHSNAKLWIKGCISEFCVSVIYVTAFLAKSELEKTLNEAVVARFKALSRHLLGEAEETHNKPQSGYRIGHLDTSWSFIYLVRSG